MIENINQRNTSFILRVHDFQVANGKLVKPDKLILVNSGDGGNMRCVFMFSLLQVMEYRSRCDNSFSKFVDAKSLQRRSFELADQLFIGVVKAVNPVIQSKRAVVIAK